MCRRARAIREFAVAAWVVGFHLLGTEDPGRAGVTIRKDRIDKARKAHLRYQTRLHPLGVEHAHKGRRPKG